MCRLLLVNLLLLLLLLLLVVVLGGGCFLMFFCLRFVAVLLVSRFVSLFLCTDVFSVFVVLL